MRTWVKSNAVDSSKVLKCMAAQILVAHSLGPARPSSCVSTRSLVLKPDGLKGESHALCVSSPCSCLLRFHFHLTGPYKHLKWVIKSSATFLDGILEVAEKCFVCGRLFSTVRCFCVCVASVDLSCAFSAIHQTSMTVCVEGEG